MIRRRFSGSEEGQALVLGAGFFALLLVFLAVTFYLGAAASQRRNLQNTADAAALGGAQELNGTAGSDGAAIASADATAKDNNSDLDEAPEIKVTDGHTRIEVAVRRTSPASFSGFGLGDAQIAARAAARIASPLLPGPGVVPLSIDNGTYLACVNDGLCNDITLKEYAGNNEDPPANYHLIDINGRGNRDVCDFLQGGSTNPITDPVGYEPGNTGISCADELLARLVAAVANDCSSWDDVTDDGVLVDRCNPLGRAGRGSLPGFPDTQPTAVVLVPVIVSFDDCSKRAGCDIKGSGNDPRLFSFFWIDPEATMFGSSATCGPAAGKEVKGVGGGLPPGQCWITGRFITKYEAVLTVSNGEPTGEFDPDAVTKVIELVE